MDRRLVHRGLAILALTAALAVAGARPAAAQDLGLFARGMRWLAAFWSAPAPAQEDRGGPQSVWSASSSEMDKGLGVDPNGGGRIVVVETPSGGN
jgi:hypothetical protein